MPRTAANTIGGPYLAAFLDMLAFSELGEKLLAGSDDGYNVLVGGGLFAGYSAHPNQLIALPRYGIKSTAAGRYQFLKRTWDELAQLLQLSDFSPESQDRAAVRMFVWAGALGAIKRGDVKTGVSRCKRFWASLPGAGYGQHEHKLADLLKVYDKALEVYS